MLYNPLKHKLPYGATALGKKTNIIFPLDEHTDIKRVFVIFRNDNGNIKKFELFNISYENALDVGINSNFINKSEKLFYCQFTPEEYGIWYYRFEGEMQNGQVAFFGKDRFGNALQQDWLPEWQLTITKIDYKTPNWAKNGLIYHIFPDRFCKGEERSFEKNGYMHENWNEKPYVANEGFDYQANDFYGGNIQGVINKLDYLKELGVSIIYFSPIFEACSNHRYDTGDYLKIDSLFGDEHQFEELIKKAKALNIQIILDGVFNHTGADSKYFNKFSNYNTLGAYQSKDSQYYDWYYFYDYPDNYHCWWGCTAVPTVNKSAIGYRKLILGEDGVVEKWTKLGVKGWRFDVVDELPTNFTTDLCQKIKQIDNEALIVGEVWEDATTKISYGELRPYFMGMQLDSVMNYPFKDAILHYVIHKDKDYFVEKVQSILENYPKQSLDVLMNLIGTHDTQRALTALSNVQAPSNINDRRLFEMDKLTKEKAIQKLKFASILQYTLPGLPCLFYGDEAGVEGFEDPMNRATYPWDYQNQELLQHYLKLGKFRNEYCDFLNGQTIFVENNNLLIYKRTNKSGEIIIFANNNDFDVEVNETGYDCLNHIQLNRFKLQPLDIKILFIAKN